MSKTKFQISKPAVDPDKLAAFAAGADARSTGSSGTASASTAYGATIEPPAIPRKEPPKSVFIRLSDTPGLAEKLQDAFHRSTFKSQHQLVVALLSDGLDRLLASLDSKR